MWEVRGHAWSLFMPKKRGVISHAWVPLNLQFTFDNGARAQVGNYPSPLLCFIGEFLRDVCAHASTPFTVHVVCYELCRVLFSMTNIALQYVWDGVNVYFRTQTVWLLYNVNNRSELSATNVICRFECEILLAEWSTAQSNHVKTIPAVRMFPFSHFPKT